MHIISVIRYNILYNIVAAIQFYPIQPAVNYCLAQKIEIQKKKKDSYYAFSYIMTLFINKNKTLWKLGQLCPYLDLFHPEFGQYIFNV